MSTIHASDIDATVAPRVSRMSAYCPPQTFQAADVVLVGAGAVGRQVAQQLACMGVASITILDHDDVSDANTGPQMYRPEDVGKNKAKVTAADCLRLNPDVRVVAAPRRAAKSDWRMFENKLVVLTVDSIDTRAALYGSAVKAKARFVGDCRVMGETIRVLTQPAPAADSPYAATLFKGGEAVRGACAGTRMCTYGATTAASLLSAKIAQYLRGAEPGPSDHTLSLTAWDLLETPR